MVLEVVQKTGNKIIHNLAINTQSLMIGEAQTTCSTRHWCRLKYSLVESWEGTWKSISLQGNELAGSLYQTEMYGENSYVDKAIV